jgi:multicomponent Na+:H+ antiporter subunit E
VLRALCTRGAGLLGFWVVWIGASPLDLACGIPTAALATALSLRLLPPGPARVRPLALARFALRFLALSGVAGFDVARRAFDPRLPLRPGFASVRAGRIPPGPARECFVGLTSLLPGTLPVAGEGDTLLFHCLDVAQPLVAQVAADEAAFCRALGRSEPAPG